MHLDPDFDYLTYGDVGQRARRIRTTVGCDDLLVFYAGLSDIHRQRIICAIIGLYVIERIVPALSIPKAQWHANAHTRRMLMSDSDDIIVFGRASVSGRLDHCLPIGSYREGAHRVFPKLLEAWGGLRIKNGYIQRSVYLPEFTDASRFYSWFQQQNRTLLARNN